MLVTSCKSCNVQKYNQMEKTLKPDALMIRTVISCLLEPGHLWNIPTRLLVPGADYRRFLVTGCQTGNTDQGVGAARFLAFPSRRQAESAELAYHWPTLDKVSLGCSRGRPHTYDAQCASSYANKETR